MKEIIYKFWYNTSKWPSKGYSVSVELNGVTQYYLNFQNPYTWRTITRMPTEHMETLFQTVNLENEHLASDQQLQLADFKPKNKGIVARPEWTAILDVSDNLNPYLMFTNWHGDEENVQCYKMDRNKNIGIGKSHTHYWKDNHDPMNLLSPRKSKATATSQVATDIDWDRYIPKNSNDLGNQIKL